MLNILMSLLLPASNRAKAKAKDALCVTHQKQVYTGIVVYTDDFKQMLPYNWVEANTLYAASDSLSHGPISRPESYNGLGWLWALYYISTPRVLWCTNEDAPKKRHASMNGYGWKAFERNARNSNTQNVNNYSEHLMPDRWGGESQFRSAKPKTTLDNAAKYIRL